jgi:hypothetical protein
MSRKARFRIYGRFNGATAATVEIDRGASVISVRPLRRRRAYELPLSVVAESIMWRIIKAEAQAKIKARKEARRKR